MTNNLYEERGFINVKDFGAKGDGKTDDTEAFQKAINSCSMAFNTENKTSVLNGGTILIPRGKYVITTTLKISTLGIELKGESTQSSVLIIAEDFKGDSLIDIHSEESAYLGKVSIENLKLDAGKNSAGVHGIKFMPIIYNNIFRNLDFESFTGAWFYSNDDYSGISEGIEWSNIVGNCRDKVYKTPLWCLKRINESIMINCKIFGKQYHEYPYSEEPLVQVDTPQQFNIISCNFNNTAGNAIKFFTSETNAATGGQAVIQGCWIQGCHFESIGKSYLSDNNKAEETEVISISGSSDGKGEYGFIGVNRYLEINKPYISIDNMKCIEINDNKPSVKLGQGTSSCVVRKMTDNNSEVSDNGSNNLVMEYNKGALKLHGSKKQSITINGRYSYIESQISEDGDLLKITMDKQNKNLKRINFSINDKNIGGFSNFGPYIPVYDTYPNDTYAAPDGTMFIDNAAGKLNIKQKGSFKTISLD